MSALKREIVETIAHDGPMTLERFMSLCLTHPRYGYYMTRDPFGAGGDFVTAPEISQMFGELLGVWVTEAWRAAGAPTEARLVELGPGRGTLMSDVLRVTPIAPNFFSAVSVHLVETSPVLRETQRQTLARAAKPAQWHLDFAETPPGPAFILANEFFDALPVRHFVKTAGGWREQLVGLDAQGELAFGLSDQIEPTLNVPAREGSIIEVSAASQKLIGDIAARLVADGGALLLIDYGYEQTSLGESLQAVSRHAYVDPLAAPGDADLTAHVDFAALARAAPRARRQGDGPGHASAISAAAWHRTPRRDLVEKGDARTGAVDHRRLRTSRRRGRCAPSDGRTVQSYGGDPSRHARPAGIFRVTSTR